MQDKQPDAFGYAYCLESRGFEAEATLLRTQHAAIERKDALLRQALTLCEWIAETQHQRGSVNGLAGQIRYAVQQELSQ